MNLSFTEYIESHFNEQLQEAVEDFIVQDNVRDIPVQVRSVSVKQIDTCVLMRCEDYACFPMILTACVTSAEDGQRYHRNIDYNATFSGSFSKSFQDFRISKVQLCKRCFKVNFGFTDDLLPKLTQESLEVQAENLLKKAYGFYYDPFRPMTVDPVFMAQKLGIHIYFTRLSEEGDIRGVYLFTDTHIRIFDDELKCYQMRKVQGNTILIEKNLKPKREMVRFTIMHELVHAVVHRFAFYLNLMCHNDLSVFPCPVRQHDECRFMDEFVERLERQADAIASFTLCPSQPFRIKADEFQSGYGALRDAGCTQGIVEKTAAFFGVSITTARRRFLELGYSEVQGVYHYLDGAYVPSFAFQKGSLQKNQTFSVSESFAKKLLESNPKLSKLIAKGAVCFVEHHFVLNTPEYLTKEKQLTTYARNHLDECALKFNLIFQDGQYASARSQLDNTVVYRTTGGVMPIMAVYADDNWNVEQKARMLMERNNEVLEVLRDLPSCFSTALSKVIDWTEMKQEDICCLSWAAERTLRNLKSNPDANPSIQIVVRLCIGMSLPYEIAQYLISRSGYQMRATPRDMVYTQLLFFSYQYDIDDCNRILISQGLAPLASKNPSE